MGIQLNANIQVPPQLREQLTAKQTEAINQAVSSPGHDVIYEDQNKKLQIVPLDEYIRNPEAHQSDSGAYLTLEAKPEENTPKPTLVKRLIQINHLSPTTLKQALERVKNDINLDHAFQVHAMAQDILVNMQSHQKNKSPWSDEQLAQLKALQGKVETWYPLGRNAIASQTEVTKDIDDMVKHHYPDLPLAQAYHKVGQTEFEAFSHILHLAIDYKMEGNSNKISTFEKASHSASQAIYALEKAQELDPNLDLQEPLNELYYFRGFSHNHLSYDFVRNAFEDYTYLLTHDQNNQHTHNTVYSLANMVLENMGSQPQHNIDFALEVADLSLSLIKTLNQQGKTNDAGEFDKITADVLRYKAYGQKYKGNHKAALKTLEQTLNFLSERNPNLISSQEKFILNINYTLLLQDQGQTAQAQAEAHKLLKEYPQFSNYLTHHLDPILNPPSK